jgi:glutathione S-transferase
MPVLEFANGKTIGQSLAIGNYVAKLAGAYPMDPMMALKNESLMNDFAEYLGDFTAPVFAPGQPELVDVVLTKTIDSWA